MGQSNSIISEILTIIRVAFENPSYEVMMLGFLTSLTATSDQRRLAREVVEFAVRRYGVNAERELRRSLTDPRVKKARKALRIAVQQIRQRQRSSIYITVA